MICEGLLQYRVRNNLEKVVDQRLVVLDWDSHKTASGRPDAVFLNSEGQLIVVEFEPALTVGNIKHSLIEQAWNGAEEWYRNASQADMRRRYEYTFQYLFPNKDDAPDIRAKLGLSKTKSDIWSRCKRVQVIAAAPHIDVGVVEAAHKAVKAYADHTGHGMPIEVLLYRIILNEQDRVVGCERTPIYSSPELTTAPPIGLGLPPPHQHKLGALSRRFQEVEQLLPEHLSSEMKDQAGYYVKCNDDFSRILKLMAWHEYDADVCFEYSEQDGANEIKGPLCVLRIGKMRGLGGDVRKHLQTRLAAIASELDCPLSDLQCKGFSWPLSQHNVSKSGRPMSSQGIARVLGTFSSVVYPLVNELVREALD